MTGSVGNRFCVHGRVSGLVLALALFAPGLLYAAPTAQILELHSYSEEYAWTRSQHEGFVEALNADTQVDVAFCAEYLDTKRRAYNEAYANDLARLLEVKYTGYKPAAIYVTDDNALLFARDYVPRVFPGTPVFFSGVNDYGVQSSLDPALFTGVFERKEVAPNIEWLLRMDAGANDLVFVGDGSNTDRAICTEIRNDLAAYPLRTIFIAEKRLDLALARLRDLPGKYLFLTTLGGMTDADGQVLPLRDVTKALAHAGRIVVSMEDSYISGGVLGGHVTAGRQQGMKAAQLLLAYLHGKPLVELPPILKSPNALIFDDQVLQQYGIALPENLRARAVLLNPRLGFYDRYRSLILGGLLGLTALLFVVVTGSLVIRSRKNRELAKANSSLQVEVAERVRAEEELGQVNRMLRVLTECNQAVVRLSDETELLLRVCRVLVDFGGYPLAWIGIVKEQDRNGMAVFPVACCGFEENLMPPIVLEEAGSEPHSGLVGEVIRTRKPGTSPDMQTNSELLPWREAALRHGCVLHAAIPLSLSHGQVSGILGVSALRSGSFAGVEMDLLRELVADLDYAVASLRTRAEYRATQEQIARLSSLKERLLGTLSLMEKLKLITDAVVSVFGADFARIWRVGEGDLCDKECFHAAVTEGPHVCRNRAHCLHLVASSGRYSHMDGNHRRVPIGCYKIGRLASGDEPAFITNDVVHDPRVHNREWAAELGLVSFAGWRLLSPEGQPVGVLALFSKHPITEAQGHLLEDLGNTASHVILTELATDALRDVERRRLIEDELRKAHGEVERLLASMSSFLIGVGPDLCISRWNAAAEATFGIRSEDAVGRRIDNSGIRWEWETVVSQIPGWPTVVETVRLQDVRYTRTDGTERFLGVTVNPVKGDPGTFEGCFLLGIDTTARRNLESQLVQAQKLEAVGSLAAGIAHEINTPTQYVGDNIAFLEIAYDSIIDLVGTVPAIMEAMGEGPIPEPLLSRVQELIEDTDLDYLSEQIPRAIEQSIEGVGRISSIVQAMKEFSHPGTAAKSHADLNQCIRSTTVVSRNEWKYVADLETDLDPNLPPVMCLAGEFNQVILNMIVNAAHAIADVAGADAEYKGTILVRTRQDGDWAVIEIVDTGAGIPEKIRDRIFDPFFTTKGVGRGTGQGLAIARNVIVEKHGGTLSVESEVGKGTTFTIRLPIEGRAGECLQ